MKIKTTFFKITQIQYGVVKNISVHYGSTKPKPSIQKFAYMGVYVKIWCGNVHVDLKNI